MTMKRLAREMSWNLSHGDVKVQGPRAGFPPQVAVRDFRGAVWTDHATWEEAFSHAEQVAGRTLRPEDADFRYESWTDGTVMHVAVGHSPATFRCEAKNAGIGKPSVICSQYCQSWEDAVQTGRDLLPAVHAALKALPTTKT